MIALARCKPWLYCTYLCAPIERHSWHRTVRCGGHVLREVLMYAHLSSRRAARGQEYIERKCGSLHGICGTTTTHVLLQTHTGWGTVV